MAETKKEKTELSIPLAVAIIKQLKEKYGIDHFDVDFSFTQEELSKITNLTLEHPSSGMKGIEYLPNLKSLSLIGIETGAFRKNLSGIDDHDMTCIEKCKNLEELVIRRQPKITSIDIGSLPKLKYLEICENHQLEKIEGIDKLPLLESLDCYGNESLSRIEHLDKVIEKEQWGHLDLDVLLFPSAIGYQPHTASYNQKAVDALNNTPQIATWSQEFGEDKERIQLSHWQMIQLHNSACQILSEILRPHQNDSIDQVMAIETYLAQNVVYDHAACERKDHTFLKTENGQTTKGPKHGSNGSYSCLVQKQCVCEGYTRGEQYLLALRGIKSRNVSCIGEKDTRGMSDSQKDWSQKDVILPSEGYHSIIQLTDMGLYSDPCWNAGRWQKGDKSMPYSLLSKEEMSKTHTLSFEERNWDGIPEHISRSMVAESIKNNDLFRKTKMAEVEAQRKELGKQNSTPVRGMISDGRS